MNDPAFTIITKALDEEAVIADAIGSALGQTRPDFELIVVDDGSTDATAEIVRSLAAADERVRLLVHAENRGVAAAMNSGVAAARAPIVCLLDADDLYMPRYLERMGEALASRPDAAFAYTSAWWLDDESGRFFRGTTSEYMGAPEQPPSDPEDLLRSILSGNWLFGLTAMRRDALLEAGGFNEGLFGCEDYEMWIRLLAAGHPGVRAAERLCIQRDRSTSVSKALQPMLNALRDVYRIAAGDLGLSPQLSELAREREAAVTRELAGLEGTGRGRSEVRRLRGRLGAVRRSLLARRIWHDHTPREISEAFPLIFGEDAV